jgi:hypothetical protein
MTVHQPGGRLSVKSCQLVLQILMDFLIFLLYLIFLFRISVGEGNWKLVGSKFLTHMYSVVFFSIFNIKNLTIFFSGDYQNYTPKKKKKLQFFLER